MSFSRKFSRFLPRLSLPCGLALSVLVLTGCSQLNRMGRDLMSKPYDAPVARAAAAAVDPSPLREWFPDMAPPLRVQARGNHVFARSRLNWSFSISEKLSIAAAPVCFGGLSDHDTDGTTALSGVSMQLDKGEAKWLFSQINWVAPYTIKMDSLQVGDVLLTKEVIAQLPDDAAMQAYKARAADMDKKRHVSVIRNGQYLIVERRPRKLRQCSYIVYMTENDMINLVPAVVRHRGHVTGIPASTTVYERALDIFPRDEEVEWFFAQEYAAGIVWLTFGGSENRDIRKQFLSATEQAIARMAKQDGIDPGKIEDKVFRDAAYVYYVALYIGNNAALQIEDYLAQQRLHDGIMLSKPDPKAVEYRERLLRHWWDELRVRNQGDQPAKPDVAASISALETL
ncbi:MAG: hypothetical protein OJK14_03335 [Achromobacter sp.]|uniref:hypothetical protein n=1 Tax=Achromobacter sp. TaxID=134375 RepID=UPI002589DE6C|nr:hypothetical protein [Achromobacter sp.]MCW0206103.1 hypothetical protein [Achromobacter sp.]